MAVVLRRKKNADPLYVSLSAGTTTLSFAGISNLSFDEEGRLVGAFLDRVTYRRALDNRVLAKWPDPQQPWRRHRRFLETAERQTLLNRCYAMAAEVAGDLAQGALTGENDLDPAVVDSLGERLAQITTWDWPRLEAERARFHAVYKPVPILPPDQYLAVVVQATEGCSYNLCTFCTFYRDRPFRIKSAAALQTHLEQVRRFLGRGLHLRRTLFLADANAVIVAQRRLIPMLDQVNQAFPILPAQLAPPQAQAWRQAHPWHLNGIYAFVSAPDVLHKTAADFADLRARNLRRVYIGLETGHDPLRAFLRKPGSAADVLTAVRAVKDGGVDVGLIFMVGIGGQRYRQPHFQDTLALLQRLPLDANDIIYLSPFVTSPTSPYSQDADQAGIVPLDESAIWQEEQRFRAALAPWARPRGVRLSHYDVREFIY